MNLQKINLNQPYYQKKLAALLEKNGLGQDTLESAYGIFGDDGELAACGGRDGNVLKCFAADERFKGLDLTAEIISALLKEVYSEKYGSSFIFTKKNSKMFFANSGFSQLAGTDDSVLLYRGEKSPKAVLAELLKTCPAGFASSKNAAIVMNANPFTLGHRCLIEQALDFCGTEKKLFVFIVQADKSFFSFKDRFYLARENTKDLKNLAVLPSSEFSISAATFPSYFLKGKILVQKNQAMLDAEMFLKYFVPIFNIGVRFLGEEPLDKSTELYNETLLKTLPPECGVKIIPRKKTASGKTISASQVRLAFQNGCLDSIKEFVSPLTYDFLKDRQKIAASAQTE